MSSTIEATGLPLRRLRMITLHRAIQDSNCRRAVPADGALLLVELGLSEPNQPSGGKIIDLFMLVLTGGRERTHDEYSSLLARAGFRIDRVVPTGMDFVILEALPV